MSQISLKSISGITSITTPASVDNQLTIHTNDTTERLKVTTSGVNVTGVITATSFQGDGSALTGIAADKIFEGNTEAEVVDTGSDGHFKVTTEGSERLRIISTGQMGLGINNPNWGNSAYNGLHVHSSGSTNSYVTLTNNATGSTSSSDGFSLAYSSNDINFLNRENGNMLFTTNGTERLQIKNTGGVGINTSLIRNNRFLNIAAPSQDFSNNSVELMDGGGICLQHTDTLASTNRTYPGIFWSGNTASLGRSRAAILGITASNNDATDIAFLTRYAANGTGLYPSDERVRITSGGKLLIGHNDAHSVGGGNSLLQIQATNSTGRISVVQHRNEAGGSPFISLGKSRGTSNGSTTILQSGDEIGTLTWAGADGNDLDNQACCITGVVDGTPGSNDMPGRLEFRTTADGSASATTRMKISKEGYVTKPNHPAFHARLQNNTSSTTNPLVYGDVRVNNGSHYKSSGTDAGKFVAPVAGIYFFYLVAVKYNNGSVCRLYPHVNGSKIYNQMHLRLQETGTYSNGSLQFCYTCSAGDKVHISLEAGQVLGAEYTHFGGFLLG